MVQPDGTGMAINRALVFGVLDNAKHTLIILLTVFPLQ